MSEPPRRRRRWILIGLAVVVLLLAGGVAVFLATRPGDVSNPNVVFRAEPTPTPVPSAPPSASGPSGERVADRFAWPMYGLSKDRRRFLPASPLLRPPFHRIWAFRSSALLEFPPVMAHASLYTLNDNGVLYAIVKRSGFVRWARRLGALAAASPAVSHGRVFAVILSRTKNGNSGRAVAVKASSGKIIWSRNLPSRSESSPLIDGGTVYFGSENGTVYAVKASNGAVRWTFNARGPVKGAVALSDGKIFFGDYAGKVYAVRETDGKLVWEASTHGAKFGFAAGRFYSTPAVAYGRVYLGNVDGNVYSFAEDTGQLAWRHGTGNYVYSSPAVGQAPGDRPTVYIGSYDGTFYALDARSGAVRWSHNAHGKISGGPTLLGDIVYFSDLANRRTIGLGARTGHQVFAYPQGGYNPVISDGRTVFLTGYATLTALRPMSVAVRKSRIKARASLIFACRKRAEKKHKHHAAVVRSLRRCVHGRRVASCLKRARTYRKVRPRVRAVRACRRNA